MFYLKLDRHISTYILYTHHLYHGDTSRRVMTSTDIVAVGAKALSFRPKKNSAAYHELTYNLLPTSKTLR
jgi:hypothetical protein